MLYAYYYHHDRDPWRRAPAMMIEIREMLALILRQQEPMMATIDQVLADVTDEGTSLAKLSTLISGLQQQLKDALAGIVVPADVQAKIDAVFVAAEANKVAIATALGQPAVPPVVPPVTP
jgi:hypothetical protein